MSTVWMYTDGACSHNQRKDLRSAGWGAVLILVDEDGQVIEGAYRELAGALPGQTNNYAELEAVRQGLLALKREGQNVVIFTDSQYVIGVLEGWIRVRKNAQLIGEIKGLMRKHRVSFRKVKGHSGDYYNEIADRLAVAESKKRV